MAIGTATALALGGAALGSAALQGRAQRKAIQAQRAGIGQQIASLEAGRQVGLEYLEPYTQVGERALSPLTGLVLGRQYDPATGDFRTITPEERMALFQESPGYQFRLEQGQQALEATQAARGGLLSGRALQEAQRLGQQEATQEYGGYLARLQSLAGIGRGAAGQAAQTAIGAAGQIGQAQAGLGQLEAQGRIARGQLAAGTLGQLGQIGGFYAAGLGGGAGQSAAQQIQGITPVPKPGGAF